MSADHQRVDGHDRLADARAAARQSDVGDLRLRAGVEAARQVDAQRLSDLWESFVERGRELVQAVLRLDWCEVAIGIARARGGVAREEPRLRRIGLEDRILKQCFRLSLGDVEQDEVLRVRRAQASLAEALGKLGKCPEVFGSDVAVLHVDADVAESRLLLRVGAVKAAVVPRGGDFLAAAQQSARLCLDLLGDTLCAEVRHEVLEAAVIALLAVALVAEERCDSLSDGLDLRRADEERQAYRKMRLCRKAAADVGDEARLPLAPCRHKG